MFRVYHETLASKALSADRVSTYSWKLQWSFDTWPEAFACAKNILAQRSHVKITSEKGTEFLNGR
jgi:hypothetical protein